MDPLSYLRRELERLRRSGMRSADDRLRCIGPAQLGHINFHGTMCFGVERYVQSLIQARGEQSPDLHSGRA